MQEPAETRAMPAGRQIQPEVRPEKMRILKEG